MLSITCSNLKKGLPDGTNPSTSAHCLAHSPIASHNALGSQKSKPALALSNSADGNSDTTNTHVSVGKELRLGRGKKGLHTESDSRKSMATLYR